MEENGSETQLIDTASCRATAWLFDACHDHSIDPKSILRGLPHDRAYLEDHSNFIRWDSLAMLQHNLSQFLSDEELYDAARLSWRAKGFRVHRVLGVLLYDLTDQLLATFNPHGFFAQLYPCQFTILEQHPGHLRIKMTMNPGCSPSKSFQIILAGQIAGLKEQMGYRRTRVELVSLGASPTYNITFKPRKGLPAILKNLLIRRQSVREAAIDLTLTHDALLNEYRKAESQEAEFKQLKNKHDTLANQYERVTVSSSEVIWTAEPAKGFTYMSPSITNVLGYSADELTSLENSALFSSEFSAKIALFLPPSESDSYLDTKPSKANPHHLTQWKQQNQRENSFELELLHRDGRSIWTQTTIELVPTGSANAVKISGITRDITNEKAAEQKLANSEANYRAITNNADDGILVVDEKNFVIFANPATTRIFGYSNARLVGLGLGDLMPEIHSENIQFDETSLNGVMQDGTPILLEMSFADQHEQEGGLTTCIIRDVTARNRVTAEQEALHEQLLAAQKMESIGQLTGGIAHDFNNLLVAINGFAELSQLTTTSTEERHDFLNQIRRAGNRAAEMTQKLLAFSRRQIIELRVIDLNTLITDLDLMIRRLLPENIEVKIHRSLEEVHVFADSGQLEQVIVNLAVNARDAMTDHGKLDISVRNQKIDKSFADNHPTAMPGDFVLITVKDTGTGIPNETMEKMFEPFFTTKPEGVGTGLGLSVVFGIISQHNGFIDVTSNATDGTSFRVFLPATEATLDQELVRPNTLVAGGTETLMLVEDNEHVRDLARLILKGAGYTVIEAVDGADAINQFRNASKNIDLVILDVVMPKMGGREVMSLMQEINPDTKILFSSGYANQGVHTHFILEQGLEFIQKPYSTESLRAKIRQTLDLKSALRDSSQ
jgi:PAS domain S-box-containing protein